MVQHALCCYTAGAKAQCFLVLFGTTEVVP